MKLSRTKEYHFGWLGSSQCSMSSFFDFLPLLSSNLSFSPASRFRFRCPIHLGPQINPQIISITGGAGPAIYFRDQKITLEQLGPLLEVAKKEGRPIIIKADRLTPYTLVMEVTNLALEHGIDSVALATTPTK
jgi:hypothetical protein